VWSGFGACLEWILGLLGVDSGPAWSGFAVDGSSDDFGRNLDVYFTSPMEPLVMPSKPG
jgi:hypothetical protein